MTPRPLLPRRSWTLNTVSIVDSMFMTTSFLIPLRATVSRDETEKSSLIRPFNGLRSERTNRSSAGFIFTTHMDRMIRALMLTSNDSRQTRTTRELHGRCNNLGGSRAI